MGLVSEIYEGVAIWLLLISGILIGLLSLLLNNQTGAIVGTGWLLAGAIFGAKLLTWEKE